MGIILDERGTKTIRAEYNKVATPVIASEIKLILFANNLDKFASSFKKFFFNLKNSSKISLYSTNSYQNLN